MRVKSGTSQYRAESGSNEYSPNPQDYDPWKQESEYQRNYQVVSSPHGQPTTSVRQKPNSRFMSPPKFKREDKSSVRPSSKSPLDIESLAQRKTPLKVNPNDPWNRQAMAQPYIQNSDSEMAQGRTNQLSSKDLKRIYSSPVEKVKGVPTMYKTPGVITAKPIREYKNIQQPDDEDHVSNNIAYNPWDNFMHQNVDNEPKKEDESMMGAPLSHTEIKKVKQKSYVRLGGAPENDVEDQFYQTQKQQFTQEKPKI